MAKQTQPQFEKTPYCKLEKIIDAVGLDITLNAIQQICFNKASNAVIDEVTQQWFRQVGKDLGPAIRTANL